MRFAPVPLMLLVGVLLCTGLGGAQSSSQTNCSLMNNGWEEWCPANPDDLFGAQGSRVWIRNGPYAGQTCFVREIVAACGMLTGQVFTLSRAATGTGRADAGWTFRSARGTCELRGERWSCGPISIDSPVTTADSAAAWQQAWRGLIGFGEGILRNAPPQPVQCETIRTVLGWTTTCK
jgi:hypothetical protein